MQILIFIFLLILYKTLWTIIEILKNYYSLSFSPPLFSLFFLFFLVLPWEVPQGISYFVLGVNVLHFLKIFVKLTFFQEFYLIAFVGAQGEFVILSFLWIPYIIFYSTYHILKTSIYIVDFLFQCNCGTSQLCAWLL